MLERDGARLEGERGALVASIAQARGELPRPSSRSSRSTRICATDVGKDLAEIRGKKSELVEKRVAAEDLLKRIDLIAPQDGKDLPALRAHGRRP